MELNGCVKGDEMKGVWYWYPGPALRVTGGAAGLVDIAESVGGCSPLLWKMPSDTMVSKKLLGLPQSTRRALIMPPFWRPLSMVESAEWKVPLVLCTGPGRG